MGVIVDLCMDPADDEKKSHHPPKEPTQIDFEMKDYLDTAKMLAGHQLIEECINSAIKKQLSSSKRTYSVLDPMIVADIGCADGQFLNEVIENIIVNEFEIQHVTKYNIDPFGLRDDHNVLTLRHDDFGKNFPANHCDMIICRFSGHLFEEYFEWLRNCCRILKPGGYLYIMNMSANMDWSEQWGKDAHRTYQESCSDPNSQWQAADGPLPESGKPDDINDVHVKQCTVKHNHSSGPISVKRTGWRLFVERKGWSNLMRLKDKEVRDAVALIDEKYGDSETVDLEMKWTLSVVLKQGSDAAEM